MECHFSSPTTSCTSSALLCSICLTPSIEPKLVTSTPTKKQRLWRCRYKGVVPQPNGRWGAQLYYGNKRVWIGTFDCQKQAAQAYDMAVIRFRGPQAITNSPIRRYSRPRLEFLAFHSEARVIDMLRNHTYEDELNRFMRTRIAMNRTRRMCQVGLDGRVPNYVREQLFEKVMTPSDVGKQHRLVIPKHHAESYLPGIADTGDTGGMMLNVEDRRRDKTWRFKYCYWRSSHNYVLTKGWGEFVKDKGLRPGDKVCFYTTLVGSERRFSIDTRCKELVTEIISNSSGKVELSSNKILRLFGVEIICASVPVVS